MDDRLFVAVIGERDAGKSTTWNTLFGSTVRTGKRARNLQVAPSEKVPVHLRSEITQHNDSELERNVEVFVISGSPEERRLYAQDVLENVNCRIVLCSVQYVEESFERTWNFVFAEGFSIYAQWLNPSHTGSETQDRLGLVNRLLAHNAIVSVRDGRSDIARLQVRTEEVRQYIHGWAAARNLLL